MVKLLGPLERSFSQGWTQQLIISIQDQKSCLKSSLGCMGLLIRQPLAGLKWSGTRWGFLAEGPVPTRARPSLLVRRHPKQFWFFLEVSLSRTPTPRDWGLWSRCASRFGGIRFEWPGICFPGGGSGPILGTRDPLSACLIHISYHGSIFLGVEFSIEWAFLKGQRIYLVWKRIRRRPPETIKTEERSDFQYKRMLAKGRGLEFKGWTPEEANDPLEGASQGKAAVKKLSC